MLEESKGEDCHLKPLTALIIVWLVTLDSFVLQPKGNTFRLLHAVNSKNFAMATTDYSSDKPHETK